MSIAVRLEKLRFLVDELQLALHLARHAPNDFVARTLARHVALRAENFIEHARGLRKPLNQAGFTTGKFNEIKENYAKNFDEYFPVVRDKLTAHVQDFDFGKRIEFWNELEVVKVAYFVDGAGEIYDGLTPLAIPGYAPRIEPAELKDTDVTKALVAFQESGEHRQWAEIGVDALAMTRPNTSSVLNLSPLHSRAGQLALIRRWIKVQRDLVARLHGYDKMVRILKARIITDVVSFFDCLVTRAVPAGSPQEMDGLDTLLVNNGKKSAAIDRFLGMVDVASALRPARAVRDRVAAHLEIEDTITLVALLHDIDTFDLESCVGFFDRLAQLFDKVCHEVLLLRLYIADGQRLYGITPSSPSSVPFDDRMPVAAAAKAPILDLNDGVIYRDNLRRWLAGDEASQQDARYYFFQAFMHSEVVEQITETEDFPGGSRVTRHTLRKAHRFIFGELQSVSSDHRFTKLVELMLVCRNGDPYMLAETLVRYSPAATPRQNGAICFGLGALASWPHEGVNAFLMKHAADNQDWNVQFQAVLALFKIYVRTEGLARMNRKAPLRSYAASVAPLVAGMPEEQRLVCLIAFASQFCSGELGNFANVLTDDYTALKSEIDAFCKGEMLAPTCIPVANTLQQLLQAHDYVGVCLLLADQLRAANADSLADALLTAACQGWVIAASHDQAIQNLAACFSRKGEFAMALEIADQLATRNPDDVMLQIFVARVLAGTPGAGSKAVKKIATIKANYTLTTAHQRMLVELERYL